MQAGVARLVEMDITLRDISTGLIDFPALVSRPPDLAVLAPRRGRRRALARARRGLRLAPPAERAADGPRLRHARRSLGRRAPAEPASGPSSRAGGRRPTARCPRRDRRAALEAGLEAYDRGDFFLAHELLEPAWMGTARPRRAGAAPGPDQARRGVRPRRARRTRPGVEKNLRGARERLASAGVRARASGSTSRALLGGDRCPARPRRSTAASRRSRSARGCRGARDALGRGRLRLARRRVRRSIQARIWGRWLNRPADDDEDHEVARADAGRGEVAELLADLATDLETRHGDADEPEPEERLLRREARPVRAGQRRRRRSSRRR